MFVSSSSKTITFLCTFVICSRLAGTFKICTSCWNRNSLPRIVDPFKNLSGMTNFLLLQIINVGVYSCVLDHYQRQHHSDTMVTSAKQSVSKEIHVRFFNLLQTWNQYWNDCKKEVVQLFYSLFRLVIKMYQNNWKDIVNWFLINIDSAMEADFVFY